MSTDKTWFDDWLKGNLFLDVGFRVAVWSAIAFLTFWHASEQAEFSPVEVFERGFKGLLPVITDVVRASFVLCLLALVLKDLEHVAPAHWGQATPIGRIGGIVRRLAGDLSLWIVGALITLSASFSVLALHVYSTGSWSAEAASFVATMGLVMLLSLALFSTVSVWVRRDVSLVSSHAKILKTFDTPWKIVLFYATLITMTWIAN